MKEFFKKTMTKAKQFVKKYKFEIAGITKTAATALAILVGLKFVYTVGYNAGRDDEVVRLAKLNSVLNF